jgi:hypothetical protein
MTADGDAEQPALSKAELRARLVGNSLEHDREDIVFWRNASLELHGETLYRLLARGRAMRAAVLHQIEERDDVTRLLLTPGHAEVVPYCE